MQDSKKSEAQSEVVVDGLLFQGQSLLIRSFHPFRESFGNGLSFLDDQELGESSIDNPLWGRSKRFGLEILGQCQTDNEPSGSDDFGHTTAYAGLNGFEPVANFT